MSERDRLSEVLENFKKPQHQHSYQVTTSDRVIVRWCTSCGAAHRCEIDGHDYGGMFLWVPIDEPRVEE